MKAMLLAAGEGARLLPLTINRPKALLPVFGKPVVGYMLDFLRDSGIKEVAINLHHQGRKIRDRLGTGSDYGVRITWSEEERLLGTAGSLSPLEYFFDETFVVVHGDNLASLDLAAIIDFHKRSGGTCTIALTQGLDPLKCGIAALDEDGRVTRFKEKPAPDEVFSDKINAGIYVLEPEIFSHIRDGEVCDFGADVFPRLVSSGGGIYGTMIDGYLCDVGLPEQWLKAHRDILDERTGVEVPGTKQEDRRIWLEADCALHPRAEVTAPVYVGARACVREGAVVGEGAVIGNDCIIGENARVAGSILGHNVHIGPDARVEDSIIEHGVVVGRGVIVEKNAIVGEGCTLGEGSVVTLGARIWPKIVIKKMAMVRTQITEQDAKAE